MHNLNRTSAERQTVHSDPIFVVGVGRSGTTLLVNLLGSHPALSPIYETPFLRNLLQLCDWASWFWGDSLFRRVLGVFAYPEKRMAAKCLKYRNKCEQFRRINRALPHPDVMRSSGVWQKYEKFPFESQNVLFDTDDLIRHTDAFVSAIQITRLSQDQIYALARNYVDRIFQAHCDVAKKPHWVNKTPRLLLCLKLLGNLYPNARCIHIVRDGRDVAASFRTLRWGPKDTGAAARRWRDRMKAREDVDTTRLKYKEVRYEDLVHSPTSSLKTIFDFLGINADAEEIAANFNIYDHRLGAWRNIFSKQDRVAFAREAGEVLIELGYEKDYTWVDAP